MPPTGALIENFAREGVDKSASLQVKAMLAERTTDFEAEQAGLVGATVLTAATASNGQYVGGIDAANSSVTFTVYAPGSGTYPVSVLYANTTGATATQTMVVNGAGSQTLTYPATSASATFAASQVVTVNVAMATGVNTLKLSKRTGNALLDRISTNPYFDFQAFPTTQNNDDTNCCHWNGTSWPFDTSMMLTGLANLLQDYAAPTFVTKQTYDNLLSQFATQQRRTAFRLLPRPPTATAVNGSMMPPTSVSIHPAAGQVRGRNRARVLVPTYVDVGVDIELPATRNIGTRTRRWSAYAAVAVRAQKRRRGELRIERGSVVAAPCTLAPWSASTNHVGTNAAPGGPVAPTDSYPASLAPGTLRRSDPRQEPSAVVLLARICAEGGLSRKARAGPTAIAFSLPRPRGARLATNVAHSISLRAPRV